MNQTKTNKPKIVRPFILRRITLDGKVWWCLCYKGITGVLKIYAKYKTKNELKLNWHSIKRITNSMIILSKEVII